MSNFDLCQCANMIRIFLVLIFCLTATLVSHAADSAERAIIGFSPDGQWFAFEEFGTSDGSGAPYTNIYVINLNTDRWAKGTPIRVNFGETVAPVSAARQQARTKAAPIIANLSISEPGILLASKPVTQISPNPRRIDFYPHMNLTGPGDKSAYVLKELDFPVSPTCKEAGYKEKGFALSVTRGGSPLKEVYRDKHIPRSRDCPVRYTLSDVVEFSAENAKRRHVVLIHVFKRGFEGPDARFLAVPVPPETKP